MRANKGFTLLELLTVIVIIIVLAALIINGMGYAQQKSASARARAEISAISTALEGYKAENGEYVKTTMSDGLNPTIKPAEADYGPSIAYLTAYLLGGRALHPDAFDSKKGYDQQQVTCFQRWKSKMDWPDSGLSTTPFVVTVPNLYKQAEGEPDQLRVPIKYFIDPFGAAYGYSTQGKFNPAETSFDLWSAAGTANNTEADQMKWITNW